MRAALQGLADDGLVTRRRRHGTVVNAHLLRASMPLNRLVSFRDLIEQCGHEPSVDPPETRRDGASDVAALALGVAPGAPCVVVDRLLRAGGTPVIAIHDVVPLEHLRVAAEDVRAGDSTFAFLASDGVARAAYATTEIVPRVAEEGSRAASASRPARPTSSCARRSSAPTTSGSRSPPWRSTTRWSGCRCCAATPDWLRPRGEAGLDRLHIDIAAPCRNGRTNDRHEHHARSPRPRPRPGRAPAPRPCRRAGERRLAGAPPCADRATLVWAETVAGGSYTHRVLARGTELRLTDLRGDACAHLLLFVRGRARGSG